MDVRADDSGLEHATIVFDRSGVTTQGQSTTRRTSYDDTDQLPVVPPQRYRRDPGSRALRVAIVVLAVVIVAAGAVLGLIKSGVIYKTTPGAPPAKTATTQTTVSIPANTPLVTQTATTPVSTSYSVVSPIYAVTVSTSAARSWVSISAAGHPPVFEGVLNPGTSQHQILLGPSVIEVGAGGTTVTVTVGKHTQVLTPPAAPYSYQFTPRS